MKAVNQKRESNKVEEKMASIKLEGVSKSFRDSSIIKNVDLTIEDGQCTVLVGPSGCGKSTILRLICGLEDVDSGNIYIGDRLVNDVPPASRGIAMVFQSYALYPHMTVFENMSFALQVRKLKKDEIQRRVEEAAKILKIDHLLQRKPKELSGGQRQRVAIGRAIVRNPYAFLFDEPLSNLDYSLRCQMRYELAKLKAQLRTTMVYVTHDQSEAMTLADKIVVMHDGIVEQEGSPLEIYNSPVNTFVAQFIGSSKMNIFPVTFEGQKGDMSNFKLETGEIVSINKKLDLKKGTKCLFGIRPEDLDVVAQNAKCSGNRLDGEVVLAENLGGEGFVYVNLKDGYQIMSKSKKTVLEQAGQKARLCFGYDRCYLFDEQGKTICGINSQSIETK